MVNVIVNIILIIIIVIIITIIIIMFDDMIHENNPPLAKPGGLALLGGADPSVGCNHPPSFDLHPILFHLHLYDHDCRRHPYHIHHHYSRHFFNLPSLSSESGSSDRNTRVPPPVHCFIFSKYLCVNFIYSTLYNLQELTGGTHRTRHNLTCNCL